MRDSKLYQRLTCISFQIITNIGNIIDLQSNSLNGTFEQKKWLLSIRSWQRIPTEYDPDQKIYDHYKNIRIIIEKIRSWIRIIKIYLSNHKYTILGGIALVKRSYTSPSRIVSFEYGDRILLGISIPRH